MSTGHFLLQVHADDSVAVALSPIAAGTTITVGKVPITLTTDVAQGHKVALVALSPGDVVRKYGLPIGRATATIAPGDHVHVHNLSLIHI